MHPHRVPVFRRLAQESTDLRLQLLEIPGKWPGSLRNIARLNPSVASQRLPSSNQMRGDGSPVSAKPLGDVIHAHAALMEFNDLVELGLREEGSSSPIRPDEPAPIVPNHWFEGALASVVDVLLPPQDNCLERGGNVLKVSTQAHFTYALGFLAAHSRDVARVD